MDHDRFDRLFFAHAARLVRLASVLGAADAEDVVQEAFRKVFAGRRRLRSDDADAVRYLRRSVINEVRDRHRRSQVAGRYLHLSRASARLSEVPDPSDRMAVTEAVRELPPRQREAVVLRFWLDLPVADVAAVMGVGVGTAKSHLSRGMAALRASLDDHEMQSSEES